MLNEVNINYRILDCRVLLWNKFRTRTLVFVNWSRRSRITLADNLFNEIYNKTKPTTRSVRRQSKWFRTWATQCCLNCSRRTLRRSAENVYHIGVKASSVAHADISWKKLWPIEVSLIIRWTFFQSQNTSSRRRDFMVTDMGKLQKKNIILSTTWKRDVSRRMSKGSTIVPHIIIFSSQTKLDLSRKVWTHHWEIFLTSTKRCLHQAVYTKNLENDHSGPCHIGSTRNGTHHRVLLPICGNGLDPGGFPRNSKKVDERGCTQMLMMERDSLFFYRFLGCTSDELLKDNTSKDPFSQCEQLQGIHTSAKSIYENIDDDGNDGTNTQSNKHNNMLNVDATLACEHARVHQLKTRECFLFVCSVVSLLCCYCFLCQWMIPCAHIVDQVSLGTQVCALFISSSSPCFSCTCWVSCLYLFLHLLWGE